jgi:hypothetical protein
VSDNYKHFICACLQIDFEKRATPEYLINYEWPLAMDYVEGVEPEPGQAPHQNYKSVSVGRMASMGNQPAMHSQPYIDEESG